MACKIWYHLCLNDDGKYKIFKQRSIYRLTMFQNLLYTIQVKKNHKMIYDKGRTLHGIES